GDGCDRFAVLEPEHREGLVAGAAAPDQRIPAHWRARDLEIHVVLIGPKPRHFCIGLLAPRHYLGDGDRLVLRVLPRLEPQLATEQRIVMSRYVASGEDLWIARAPEFVGDDAVLDREAGGLGDLDIRLSADAGQHNVSGDGVAIAGVQHESVTIRLDPRQRDSREQLDAVATVQLRHEAADF